MRLRVGVIGVLLAVLVVFPAVAQDGLSAEELALLETLQSVTDNFLASGSYHAQGNQTIEQQIKVAANNVETTIDQTILQDISGMIVVGEAHAAIRIEQDILTSAPGQPAQEMHQVMELIIVDDGLYMRAVEAFPEDIAQLLPKDWINIAEDPSAFPGGELIQADQYINIFSTPGSYGLNAETIDRITELESEEIDGVTYRVIEVEFNTEALFNSGELEQMLGAFDMSQLGVDMEMLLQAMSETAVISSTFWIGPDDMIYQSGAEMSFSAELGNFITGIDNAVIDQTVNTIFTFSDFGEEFEITAPETGE